MTSPLKKFTNVSSSSSVVTTSTESQAASTGSIKLPADWMVQVERAEQDQQDVDAAVLSHFQALRRLGRTQGTLADVSSALGLSIEVTLEAVKRLTSRGIKLL